MMNNNKNPDKSLINIQDISSPSNRSEQDSLPFPYLDLSPNSELIAQGWERRFMLGPDRLDETCELYTELGYEVHKQLVEPPVDNQTCFECQTVACKDYVTIYTRKIKNS